MVAAAGFGVGLQAVAVFVFLSAIKQFVFAAFGKIVFIHKIFPGVVGRVYVNHFYLAEVAFLQEFQHL